MHQPRGVGLMHARHKPSDAHYTHDEAAWRKRHTNETQVFPVNLQCRSGVLNCHLSQIARGGPEPPRYPGCPRRCLIPTRTAPPCRGDDAWVHSAVCPGPESRVPPGQCPTRHGNKLHLSRFTEPLPITPCCDSRHVVQMESRKLGKAKAGPEEKVLPPDPSLPARTRAPTRSTPRYGRSVVGLRT
jgi:hypothetical protein